MSIGANTTGSGGSANVSRKLAAIRDIVVTIVEASGTISGSLADTSRASNGGENIGKSIASVSASVAVRSVRKKIDVASIRSLTIAERKVGVAFDNLADANVALLGQRLSQRTLVVA